MKLYELIELGSTAVTESHKNYLKEGEPIVSGWLFGQPVSLRTSICGCLLGTAAFACGARPLRGEDKATVGKWLYRLLLREVPTASEPVECPAADEGCDFQPVGQLLTVAEHLHQFHEWPRQRIAEWLKPIEDAWEVEQKAKAVAEEMPVSA